MTKQEKLRFGCEVDQDSDGDWVIIPPEHVTIFSAPGEPFILWDATNEAEALAMAHEYLAAV